MKRVPEVVKRLTERFAKERQGNESFADFANRIGKKTIRAMVEELQEIPTYDQDPSFYSDWGDPREYRSPTWARASARARWCRT